LPEEDDVLTFRTRIVQNALRTFTVLSVAIVAVDLGHADDESSNEDVSLTSYSIGHQIGMDLVRQDRSVDLAAVERGLRDGLKGAIPALPVEELDALVLGLKQQIVSTEREARVRGAPTLRQAGTRFMVENAEREEIAILDSGLQYRVIRAGKGKRALPTDRVQIRYRSWRLDGRVFHDSTQPESEPETMRVGELIRGLREALPLMDEGARWEIFIPPELAFGRRGPLADHTVVYDLELLAVVSGDTAGSEPAP
jgi:FKBP-type peptidyl-prolyl cis-trans isomerase FklB